MYPNLERFGLLSILSFFVKFCRRFAGTRPVSKSKRRPPRTGASTQASQLCILWWRGVCGAGCAILYVLVKWFGYNHPQWNETKVCVAQSLGPWFRYHVFWCRRAPVWDDPVEQRCKAFWTWWTWGVSDPEHQQTSKPILMESPDACCLMFVLHAATCLKYSFYNFTSHCCIVHSSIFLRPPLVQVWSLCGGRSANAGDCPARQICQQRPQRSTMTGQWPELYGFQTTRGNTIWQPRERYQVWN